MTCSALHGRAALFALLVGSCGGNATEEGRYSEPSPNDKSTGGNFTDPMDLEDSVEEDPLLDESFDAALEEALRESCRLQIEYSGTTQWGTEDECTEFFEQFVHANYDIESRTCRAATLDAYECFNETWSCGEGNANCSVVELSGCLLGMNDD